MNFFLLHVKGLADNKLFESLLPTTALAKICRKLKPKNDNIFSKDLFYKRGVGGHKETHPVISFSSMAKSN
jgi:hypothetical protein